MILGRSSTNSWDDKKARDALKAVGRDPTSTPDRRRAHDQTGTNR
jgi:hypothetical protein